MTVKTAAFELTWTSAQRSAAITARDMLDLAYRNSGCTITYTRTFVAVTAYECEIRHLQTRNDVLEMFRDYGYEIETHGSTIILKMQKTCDKMKSLA